MRFRTLPLLAALVSLNAMAQPDLPQLEKMMARLAPVELKVDVSGLSEGDRKALGKLVQAAQVIDQIYREQVWSGNAALEAKLAADRTPLGKARTRYYLLNKGPWSELDGNTPFIPGVPARPDGANFYPPDMKKAEFDNWAAKHPEAAGFFTVIRRNPAGGFLAVPYSQEYRKQLERAAGLLREAAALTENRTLRHFLNERARAFLSNDYYASDVAWMDLDAPLEVTLGPYETYMDRMFGYKAAFEAYITVRDDKETAKLKLFSDHLQEIEDNLPIEPRYRNPKLGGQAPIRVVNEAFAAGDGAHGVRTAAFNLPNDERVVREKGSKRVMLKNVQEAKYRTALEPIAARVLAGDAQSGLSFDSFFTHILAHELSHGIGPHQVGDSTPRQQLKELYSAIEEAKADICGLFMLQYFYDHRAAQFGGGAEAERKLYATFLASTFRSLRFGLHEAHGKGMALQFNYLSDKGAIRQAADGRYALDLAKMKAAVRDLTHDILTVEATGDYAGAKRMLDTLGVVRPALQETLDKLKDLPTDIAPEWRE